MKSIYLLLIIVASVNLAVAQKFKPTLNLKKDSIYYFSTSAKSVVAQSIGGRQSNANLSMATRMAFKVISISDTLYNMEVSYRSLSMDVQAGAASFVIDSKAAAQQDIPSQVVAAMMDKPFNVILSKTGKVSAVSNVEQMIDGALSNFPQLDSAKKTQLKAQLFQSFGSNAFKSNLEMTTAIFPDKPLAKNDTWTINTIMQNLSEIDVSITYQLIDISGSTYQIHGEGTISTAKNARESQMNGLPVKYMLNGTLLSDVKVNKATGWISELNLRQLMSGSLQVPDNKSMPGGITIPMTFNTTITTTGK